MLIDRESWPLHRNWAILFVLGTVGSLVWYIVACFDAVDWPGGSSLPGFTFGIVGGVIILFEMVLWLRRKVRTWRVGSAQSWLRAHIWLGLLSLPLLILHSGLRFGGTLTTTLMILFILVIASGIWGLTLQNLLPRMKVDETPGETTYVAMEQVVGQLLTEGDELIASVCGAKPDAAGEEQGDAGVPVIVGVGRRSATMRPAGVIAETEPLAEFYREQVVPFLREGTALDSPLANPGTAGVVFQNLKARLPAAAHDVVDALADLCDLRRQWDREARLQFWLHNWLWVHYPLSVALVVLMIVHVVTALKYW
ncbi:MAG: hypothetical protein FJ303_15565 [Planctomycetes bacterium]|nr:hypothetical protein [Planctomycetota bacterium]